MEMTRLIATDSWSGKMIKAKLEQWSRQRKTGFEIFRSHQPIYYTTNIKRFHREFLSSPRQEGDGE